MWMRGCAKQLPILNNGPINRFMFMNDNKKRFLIFSTAYLPFVGGAELAVKNITDRILEVEFVMVTARLNKNLPEKEKIGNVFVHRFGKGNKWDKFRLILRGARFAKTLGKFDLIWSIMASYAGFAALNYKKSHPNIPYLLTLQEGDSRFKIYKNVWFVWLYFKQIFKRADYIQAISNYLANWARDMGAKCPVKVIPNGVDIAKFTRLDSAKLANIKIEDHIPCEHKRVITTSRLVAKNAVEDLIMSAEYLPENIHFTIIGSGKLENSLKKLAADRGWESRAHFLGSLEHDDIVLHLQQSQVFCRPSLSEGLGNSFLEAMAVGVPVIGTNVGGIPDFLQDGKTGWFCEIKNPKSIAEKIKYVLDEKNKVEVDKVRDNAKKLVVEKYNWDIIAKQMKQLFGW